jgi:hypothetical protein
MSPSGEDCPMRALLFSSGTSIRYPLPRGVQNKSSSGQRDGDTQGYLRTNYLMSLHKMRAKLHLTLYGNRINICMVYLGEIWFQYKGMT